MRIPRSPRAICDELPLVFAGYGLAVPDIGYDDYSRIDVTGKAVLIFSHEPQERDASSRLNGTRPMPQTTLASKALARAQQGREAPARRRRPDSHDRRCAVRAVRRAIRTPKTMGFRC